MIINLIKNSSKLIHNPN